MTNDHAQYEQEVARTAVGHHVERNPGAVVRCNHIQRADLSDEPGHVHSIHVDGTSRGARVGRRVRVTYGAYGQHADVSALVDDLDAVAAGDLTLASISPHSLTTHVEFIRQPRRGEDGPRTLDELRAAVNEYITERWDPDWPDRERIEAEMGDGTGGDR